MIRAMSLTLSILMALSSEASTRVVRHRENSHRTVTTKSDRAPCVYDESAALQGADLWVAHHTRTRGPERTWLSSGCEALSPLGFGDSETRQTQTASIPLLGHAYDVNRELSIERGREAAFTGHRFEEALGLSYAEQRWLDSSTGTFLSRDPVGPSSYLARPSELYAWGYAAGNPTRFVDANGRQVAEGPDPLAHLAEFWIQVQQGLFGGHADNPCAGTGETGPGCYGIWRAPSGMPGGIVGGGLREASFRTLPMEEYPTETSLMGMELGAQQVPIIGAGQRLVTGETVIGRRLDAWDRSLAAMQVGLEVLPFARGGAVAALSTRPGRTLALSAYLRTAPMSLVSPEEAAARFFVARSALSSAASPLGSDSLAAINAAACWARPAGGAGLPPTQPVATVNHVSQKAGNWCGAACAEMAAERLGVCAPQERFVATRFFEEELRVGDQIIRTGGFQTTDLAYALEELASVPGRKWVPGNFNNHPQFLNTPEGLRRALDGFLRTTKSSIVLRVRGGNHWVVVDAVDANGILVRDPAKQASQLMTPQQLFDTGPTGDAVLSFPR